MKILIIWENTHMSALMVSWVLWDPQFAMFWNHERLPYCPISFELIIEMHLPDDERG